MTERRTPEDRQQPPESLSIEEVKRLAQEAGIEIDTTKKNKATDLQTRLTDRQAHRTEERKANNETGQMEDIAQQLSARIATEGDERARRILEMNLVKINEIIEKRRNELKNTIEPKTDQALGQGEERQESINALHDEALKEEQERNPLGLKDTEMRLAKNAIDDLLAEMAKFVRKDAGNCLRISREQSKNSKRKEEIEVKLRTLELQIQQITDALKEKWFGRKTLGKNLARANEEKDKLREELNKLNAHYNTIIENWRQLNEQLTSLSQQYIKSIQERRTALKKLTEEQVEELDELRIEHRAEMRGLPDNTDRIIPTVFPFLEQHGRLGRDYQVTIKSLNGLLENFPAK